MGIGGAGDMQVLSDISLAALQPSEEFLLFRSKFFVSENARVSEGSEFVELLGNVARRRWRRFHFGWPRRFRREPVLHETGDEVEGFVRDGRLRFRARGE